MYGFVVVDDDNNVVKIVPEGEYYNYMTVDNLEEYKIGDKYPVVDLDDYQIAEVKFVDGVSDKSYYFKDYNDTWPNTLVVVDTVYGMQVAKVISTHSKEGWTGIQPTKDIIGEISWFDDYKERQEKRKKIAEEKIRKQREEERRKEEEEVRRKFMNLIKPEKKDNSNVHVFEFDEKNIDDFYKVVRKILGEFIDD